MEKYKIYRFSAGFSAIFVRLVLGTSKK